MFLIILRIGMYIFFLNALSDKVSWPYVAFVAMIILDLFVHVYYLQKVMSMAARLIQLNKDFINDYKGIKNETHDS